MKKSFSLKGEAFVKEDFGWQGLIQKLLPRSRENLAKNKSIWRKLTDYSLSILVVGLPLFFLPATIYPLDINKMALASILLLIITVSTIFESFESGQIIWPKSIISYAVLGVLGSTIIGYIFSIARGVSLYGNLVSSDSLLAISLYVLTFFVGALYLTKNRIMQLLPYLLGSLGLVSLFGLSQIIPTLTLPWSFTRQGGFNTAGSLLNWTIINSFGFIITLCILTFQKVTFWTKISGASLMMLFFASLLAINYQEGWYMLVFSSLLIGFFRFVSKGKLNPLLIASISIFLFLAIFSRSLPLLVTLPEMRPNLQTSLNVARQNINWPRAIIGSGPAAFEYRYAFARPIELNQTGLWGIRFRQGYSFLTTLLTTGGLLSILAWLGLIIAFIWKVREQKDNTVWAVVAVGSFALIFAMFIAPLFFLQGILLFLFLGATAGASDNFAKVNLNKFSRRSMLGILLGAILIMSLTLGGMYQIAKKYSAALFYKNALNIYNSGGDSDNSLTKLELAINLDPDSDQYLITESQLLYARTNALLQGGIPKIATEGKNIEAQNLLYSSINRAKQATVVNPANPDTWANLAAIYDGIIPIASGADTFAEQNHAKVMALDPNNPQEPVEAAKSLIASADIVRSTNAAVADQKIAKAKELITKSIKLKPDYVSAYFLDAVLLMRANKPQEVDQRLKIIKQLVPNDANVAVQLGQMYYQSNSIQMAQKEFERAVGLNPMFLDARYLLGLLYDQQGNKQAAMEQFTFIGNVVPNNQEIPKIIDNLTKGKTALDGLVTKKDATQEVNTQTPPQVIDNIAQ
ncbi:MAG: tetratricopeptide repeat protein [Candidatus Falkowbacteria bacterium]